MGLRPVAKKLVLQAELPHRQRLTVRSGAGMDDRHVAASASVSIACRPGGRKDEASCRSGRPDVRRTSGDAGPRLCDTVRKEAAGAPPIPLPLEARATGTKLWLARLGRFPRSSTAAAAPMNVVAVSHLVGRRPIRRSATSRPAWVPVAGAATSRPPGGRRSARGVHRPVARRGRHGPAWIRTRDQGIMSPLL
jgi:hypothetical protein